MKQLLAEIFRRHHKDIYQYLFSLCRDASLAEDLTSEVFLQAVKSIGSFRGASDVKTWLYTIARNTAIDYLRRHKNAALPLEETAPICDEEVDLERSYIQQEDRQLLHSCMKRLKPEYRQVLWLSYFEGFSYQQIGHIMKKTTHGVETLAYRARLALKNILIKEGFDYEGL
jgi:RNA polymerase sigma-70 factor (ECF subfamily)